MVLLPDVSCFFYKISFVDLLIVDVDEVSFVDVFIAVILSVRSLTPNVKKNLN